MNRSTIKLNLSCFYVSCLDQFEPGFITFRVFNEKKSAMALCSGIKPTGCQPEHVNDLFWDTKLLYFIIIYVYDVFNSSVFVLFAVLHRWSRKP